MHAFMLKPNRYCSPASSGNSSGPCLLNPGVLVPVVMSGISASAVAASALRPLAGPRLAGLRLSATETPDAAAETVSVTANP
jgi:hypothetical protein